MFNCLCCILSQNQFAVEQIKKICASQSLDLFGILTVVLRREQAKVKPDLSVLTCS